MSERPVRPQAEVSRVIYGSRDRRWTREALCAVVGALVVTALFALTQSSTGVSGDQQQLNVIVEKRWIRQSFSVTRCMGHPPSTYTRPRSSGFRRRLPTWRGRNPVAALHALAWPVGVIFLLGHYVLFRSVAGSPMAAGLGAVSALTIRNSLSGDYWGFDGLRSVQPRTLVAAVVPLLLLLLFLRWRRHATFPCTSCAWGFCRISTPFRHSISRRSPPADISGSNGSVGERSDRSRSESYFSYWERVPLLFLVHGGRDNVADPTALSAVRAGIVGARFPYALYPISAEALISVGIQGALLVGVVCWLAWNRDTGEDLQILLLLALIAVVLGVVGTAIVQAVGRLSDRPYVDILQLRATKLAYPGLLAALAMAYAHLLARRSKSAIAALALLFLLSLVPPTSLIHASPALRVSAKRLLGMAVPVTSTLPPVDLGTEQRLWAWVASATAVDALFFTDLDDVRFRGKRSITGTFKDGGWLFLGGTRPFLGWYTYMREVDRCLAARGGPCWFELGRRYGADYVLVDPRLQGATPPPGFERVWAEGDWSVWRRTAESS